MQFYEPGVEILGYRLLEIVGEGGMASVWRAEHPGLGKHVAIKLLDPVLARDKDIVERFVNEARIESRLAHPNIVTVENLSEEPPAIVMELVEGRSLSDVIGKEVGPIPFERARPFMEQILDGIGHAHAHGVIHRDIKPSNVLVDSGGRCKVMDFGIAKMAESGKSRTRTGATLGTVVYMSPEQVRGARDVDVRSDIYSLGITFYEMLAGRTPFDGDADTDFAIMEAHVRSAPPDPRTLYPGIPEAAVAFVMKAISKEPGERYQSVAEMRAALEDAARGVAPAPAPATPSSRDGHAPQPAPVVPAPSSAQESALDEVLPPKRGRAKLVVALALIVVLASVMAAALGGKSASDQDAPTGTDLAAIAAAPGAPAPSAGRPAETGTLTSLQAEQAQARAETAEAERQALEALRTQAEQARAAAEAQREQAQRDLRAAEEARQAAERARAEAQRAATSPAVPRTSDAEVERRAGAFINDWLGTQNRGSLADYGRHYCGDMVGVRRSHDKLVYFRSSGEWLADRRRMFQKSMYVDLSDLRVGVRATGDAAADAFDVEARFTQYYASGSFADCGPKLLRLRYHAGSLCISYEEMESSRRWSRSQGKRCY